ncbi:3'-5' exonuclease family protein [Caballeronia humi]|uniref:DNA-directed DNA polymerase n=1 Tax=Caballeronia humi TaxID=326474 RepID=A0A158IQL3_9BURK|nr:3'-5' exonuclease family protein [Caballeronia humi]SAL58815.1 DNA polymerase/helicase [Caballeronia humi]
MPPALSSDSLADALLEQLARPIVFVDLETTGGNATTDRITEIGVVEVSRAGVERWSVLVDPETPVPPFIERLTGIDDTMLRGQPTFATLADALVERLSGKLFVAHNARFDYGFLKNEFRRAGLTFRADVLCTVRLSRALFPSVQRHGLDSLIARFGLAPEGRHRALADADLLWQFWQKIHEQYSQELVDAAVRALIRRAALPAALPESALDALPSTPGVYIFYGDDELPLYVGKSINLKQRVMSHFSGDHRLAKDLAISQTIRRIEARETIGELGALLLEARLVKELQPVHNRLLRRATGACTWQWPPGAHAPVLIHAKKRDFSREDGLFGIYQSRAKAQAHLRRLAEEHGLCYATLGLERIPPGSLRGCFGFQVHRCKGACVGAETLAEHSTRVREALDTSRVVRWPHAGAIAIAERDGETQRMAWHVVDRWCYIGSCAEVSDIAPLVAASNEARPFDADVYNMLAKRLVSGELEWTACDVRPAFELAPLEMPLLVPRSRSIVRKLPRKLRPRECAAQLMLSFG